MGQISEGGLGQQSGREHVRETGWVGGLKLRVLEVMRLSDVRSMGPVLDGD